LQKGPDQDTQGKPETTSWVIWALIFVLVYYTFILISQKSTVLIPYTQFKAEISAGNITKIWMQGHHAWGLFEHPPKTETAEASDEPIPFETYLPAVEDPEFIQLIKEKNVQLMVEPDEQPIWLTMIFSIIPLILLIAFFVYSRNLKKK
jgi:ATP-dependent Zn protease